MGIQGLLPFLKKASRAANIKEFKGSTVAIDSYCWLHRGAFACAEKLAMGEKTDQYVFYCMKYVNSLLAEGLKPIMVFDGCHLPSKKEVEKTRRERRDTYRKKAAQFLREGKRSEARDCLTKCIDITPQMALELMNACRSKGVDCIVAPYEADAQLAYLSKAGIAQVIITEDSDLVLFGCDKVMFKMDFSGNGVLIEKKNLNTAMDLRPDSFTFEKFRYMCILSGCDYLASLPGIGLGKANKLFKLTKQTDMNLVLKKIPSTLKMSTLSVPSEYISGFQRANQTFLYQLVFDPMKRALVPLTEYPPEVDPAELDFAGPYIEKHKALHIALGNIDIYTGEKIADFNPDTYQPKSSSWKNNQDTKNSPHMLSVWDRNYRPMSKNGSQQKQESLLSHMTCTRGQEVTVKVPKILHKKSLVKRQREEEDMPEAELLSEYHTDDLDLHLPKRHRTNDLSMQDALEMTESIPIPPRNHKTTPSVVKVSPKVTKHPTQETHSPRNDIVSPTQHRNRFAIGSGTSKNHRFSLNKSKNLTDSKHEVEVKSRFFKEERPMSQTSFYKELDRGHTRAGLDSSGESGSEGGDTDRELEEETVVEDDKSEPNSQPLNRSSQGRESPYGSFGFSKKVSTSLLTKFKSNFDKTEQNKGESTSAQFKRVIPKTECVQGKENFKSDMEFDVEENEINDIDIEQHKFNMDSQTSVSQKTNLYSIDSFSQLDMDIESLESSHDVTCVIADSPASAHVSTYFTESTSKTTSSIKNVGSSIISTVKSANMDTFYQRLSFGESPVDATQKAMPSTMTQKRPSTESLSGASQSEQVSKPSEGCRASGLSKASSKGRLKKEKSNNENQPAISNFFSKFNYSKSTTIKLSNSKSSTKKVLSPSREINASP